MIRQAAACGVAVLCTAAAAQDIYVTGFEPPAFIPGDLVGQDGWTSSDPTAAYITDVYARDGAQSVFIDPAGGDGWWWKPVNYDPGASGTPVVDVTVDMMIGSGLQPSGIWGLDIYDELVNRITTWYVVDTGRVQFWDGVDGSAVPTSVVVPRDQWVRYRCRIDFARREASLYVQDQFVATHALDPNATGSLLADADLWLNWPGQDWACYDNLQIRSHDCPPDLNGDGLVNSQDFILFLNLFTAGDPAADFNGDGIINSQDFIAFLNAFVAGC